MSGIAVLTLPWDLLPACTKLYGVTLLKTVFLYLPCNVIHYYVGFVPNFAFPSALLYTCHEVSAVCTTPVPLVEPQLLSARQRSSNQATDDRLSRRKRRHYETERRDHTNADLCRSLIECNVHGSVLRENILIYVQQDAPLHSLFYLETALHVSGGTSTHHQERKQLYLQHLVFVRPLLLPAASGR